VGVDDVAGGLESDRALVWLVVVEEEDGMLQSSAEDPQIIRWSPKPAP
jgi:hypothetical protein